MANFSGGDSSAVELMQELEAAYRRTSGVSSRAQYSIFYARPARAEVLFLNWNPGGSESSYSYVDVEAGEHEFIENRNSGPTTRNMSELLHYLVGNDHPEAIRSVQVANVAFRRSRNRGEMGLSSREAAIEAREVLQRLIIYVAPSALVVAGDRSLQLFAQVHGGRLMSFPESRIDGPNGSNRACYFMRYQLELPYFSTPVDAFSIYHPSKMNAHFRKQVFPVLRQHLGERMSA